MAAAKSNWRTSSVNLTINLEPVYGIGLAVLVFGSKERMAAGFYWGTLLIVFSVLIHPLVAQLMKDKKPATAIL